MRTHTLWLLPNCNVTRPNVTVAESYDKFVAGSGGCTVYTSPGSCVETFVTVRLSCSAVVGVRTTVFGRLFVDYMRYPLYGCATGP